MGRTFADEGKEQRYASPRDEFIYSEKPISIKELYRKWKGHPEGRHFNTLSKVSKKENWHRQREDFWIEVNVRAKERMIEDFSERRKSVVLEANKFHVKIGRDMQVIGMKNLVNETTRKPVDMKPGEAVRAVKDGVAIERKGLGLEDRYFIVRHTEKVVQRMLMVIKKHVTDVEVLENVAREFEMIVGEENSKLDELVGTQAEEAEFGVEEE